jgi:hypothetical protein
LDEEEEEDEFITAEANSYAKKMKETIAAPKNSIATSFLNRLLTQTQVTSRNITDPLQKKSASHEPQSRLALKTAKLQMLVKRSQTVISTCK